LAQSAAPEIRDALEVGNQGEAVSLEHHLRTVYRDTRDPYDRRRFFSIALYLQDLLWQASQQSIHYDNTDRLVATLLRHFDHVCFITLNYDTILDQALSKLDRIDELDDYIRHRRWSLIKLHGSVDWGYRPKSEVDVDNPPPNLDAYLGKEIFRGQDGWGEVSSGPPRFTGSNRLDQTKLFPALTVPVGEEDEIVCPDFHQRFLNRRLQDEAELDLLILGYSAYDRTVLHRIAHSEKRIRSLMVVNTNRKTGIEVVERLRRNMPRSMNGTEISLAEEPFGQWCRTALQPFASSFSTG
jgi:hypothetical protein